MRNYFVALLFVFFALFQGVRYFFLGAGLDRLSLLVSVLIVLFCLLLFLLYKENVDGAREECFRVSYLFIIGFSIVHFQMYVDYLLGNYYWFRNDYFINEGVVVRSAIVSSLGLIAFLIGYTCAVPVMKERAVNSSSAYMLYDSSLVIKALIFVFFGLFLLTADFSYFSGGYGVVELSKLATHAQTFLLYAVACLVALKSYLLKRDKIYVSPFKYFKYIGLHVCVLLAFYLCLVLASGDRGPFIQILLLFFAGYVFTQRFKLKFLYFLVGICAASLLITFLGHFRELSSVASYADRISEIRATGDLKESAYSVSPSTHELAISVRTVHAAVDYVDKYGMGYGLLQLNQLMAAVPGAGTAFRVVTGYSGDQLISADIITSFIGSDHGLGTSTVADIYLDFGVAGVVVVLLLFGVFVRKVDVASFSSSVPQLFFWVVVMVLISKSVYIGRSSIMVLFKDCVAIYAIILFSRLILRRA